MSLVVSLFLQAPALLQHCVPRRHRPCVMGDGAISKHLRCEELRAELEGAVMDERYDLAARLRDELALLQLDERLAVLDAKLAEHVEQPAVLPERSQLGSDVCQFLLQPANLLLEPLQATFILLDG